jgi:3',5'-cyclic AMP phosphodiesterase CpdA
MCDDQLGMGGYAHDTHTFTDAVQKINALQPDAVIICGDLVDQPNDKSYGDFNQIKAGITALVYCAPGNHDMSNKPGTKNLEYYRKTVGPDYCSFKIKGVTFVIVNTQLWKSPLEIESAKMDQWFVDTLKKAKLDNSPVIVAGHYPYFLKSVNEKEEYFNLPVEKRKELIQLFRDYGVIAVLSGHAHKTILNEYAGIHWVSGESTCVNFDKRPMGFRLWTFAAPGKINCDFVAVDNSVK